MPRPREFDSDTVVENAMRVFWSKGFEATSLDDLCSATGLNRSSLYASFGDKRALLLMSLERYGQQGPARIAKMLAPSRPIRDGLTELLSEFVDRIVSGPGRSGCFIGNCAAELARHDRQALQIVQQAMKNNEAVLHEALARAQKRGELKKDANVTALARFFMSSLQGLRLVGKANPDRKLLQDIATTMLQILD